LGSEPFDIVILDVMLPGMDGIQILTSIREEPSLNRVPVLMLSAKTDDATTWAGWRAGCDYYMTKPFDPDELLSILKRLEPARSL
jgi:DNA-binding response OmpR family regulator